MAIISNEPEGLYYPAPVGELKSSEEQVRYLLQELDKISVAFSAALARKVEVLNVAPNKPQNGDTCLADGTNWDPGSGQGVYTYYGAAWNKLG